MTVVRNAADDLDRTCRSLEPFAGRFAHVVIDGASDDETLTVARRWAEILGSAVYSEPDHGPYDAMNKALALVDPASFIWFMNAGDRIADDAAFEAVIDWVGNGVDEWCFGKVRMVGPSQSAGVVPEQGSFSRSRHAYGRVDICHQAVVARCGALRAAGGFSDAYPVFADFHLLVRLSAMATPTQLDVVLADYDTEGISSRHRWRNHLEQAAARRDALGLTGFRRVADHLYLCWCLASFGARSVSANVRQAAKALRVNRVPAP